MADTKNSGGAIEDDPEAQPWLTRFSAQGWIERSLRELSLAQEAFASRAAPAAAAALKRAAGMALNGALRIVPRENWGRTYVEHLQALTSDTTVPIAVADAAQALLDFAPLPGNIVFLRTPAGDERLLEAARTVMAHAYAIVNGSAGRVPVRQ